MTWRRGSLSPRRRCSLPKNSRFTIVEFPVFSHYIVHVEVAKDFKKAFARYKHTKCMLKEPDQYWIDAAVTIQVKDRNISYVFLHPHANVNTIAHESWHVICRMLDYMGCERDDENEAYHLGYLVGKIYDFVNGRKLGNK